MHSMRPSLLIAAKNTNLGDLLYYIIFGAECGPYKRRGCRKPGQDVFDEPSVVCSDTEPRGGKPQ